MEQNPWTAWGTVLHTVQNLLLSTIVLVTYEWGLHFCIYGIVQFGKPSICASMNRHFPL